MFGTAVLLAASMVGGQQADSTMRGYFEFWKPHVGAWDVTVKEEGKKDFAFQILFEPSETKLFYRSQLKVGEMVLGEGLHGYDPDKECWFEIHFSRHDDSYLFSPSESRTDIEGGLVAGSKLKISAVELVDGKRLRTTSTRVYKEFERNRIVYVAENRLTKKGDALPDVTLIWRRK